MPSSTSSSDAAVIAVPVASRARCAASDRVGPSGRRAAGAGARHSRAAVERDFRRRARAVRRCWSPAGNCTGARQGAVPGYHNSNAEWAQQRRRIDAGEGDKTVLVGSSRILFDVQLPVWERVTGERPIQLAIEGTSPVPVLEDLADDPNFTGRLRRRRGVGPVLHRLRVSRRCRFLSITRKARRSASATGCRARSSSRSSRSTISISRSAPCSSASPGRRGTDDPPHFAGAQAAGAGFRPQYASVEQGGNGSRISRARAQRSGRNASTARRRRRWTRPKSCRRSSTSRSSARSPRSRNCARAACR